MTLALWPARDRKLIEALGEPALVIHNGRVRLANAAARALLGNDIEAAAAQAVLPHPAIGALLRGGLKRPQVIELAGLAGSRRQWLARFAPLSGGGSVLVRLIDRSEARAAEQMRVDFVANASHELRTPLSTLIGYTETLREQAASIDAPTHERFLGIIHGEARRMQGIVEDLISLSRIEAEKFSAPTKIVPLRPLIDHAVANAKGLADQRGSALIRDLSPRLPDIVADDVQILQVLDNLITNALRYGNSGTPVIVSASREGGMVHLCVADQGEGIAGEHIPRLTERFYRVDTSRSRSLGGTGLGLSIVKHIVERHRGSLQIESELGRGTKVHVLLPIASEPLS